MPPLRREGQAPPPMKEKEPAERAQVSNIPVNAPLTDNLSRRGERGSAEGQVRGSFVG